MVACENSLAVFVSSLPCELLKCFSPRAGRQGQALGFGVLATVRLLIVNPKPQGLTLFSAPQTGSSAPTVMAITRSRLTNLSPASRIAETRSTVSVRAGTYYSNRKERRRVIG